MPVEIFELVIRATVSEGSEPSRGNAAGIRNSGNSREVESRKKQDLADQMNELINRKKER